jgi:hypothetical protein
MQQAGRLHLNNTHLVRGGHRELLQKQAIYEAEVADKVFWASLIPGS